MRTTFRELAPMLEFAQKNVEKFEESVLAAKLMQEEEEVKETSVQLTESTTGETQISDVKAVSEIAEEPFSELVEIEKGSVWQNAVGF
jgi:hypothetical protein